MLKYIAKKILELFTLNGAVIPTVTTDLLMELEQSVIAEIRAGVVPPDTIDAAINNVLWMQYVDDINSKTHLRKHTILQANNKIIDLFDNDDDDDENY